MFFPKDVFRGGSHQIAAGLDNRRPVRSQSTFTSWRFAMGRLTVMARLGAAVMVVVAVVIAGAVGQFHGARARQGAGGAGGGTAGGGGSFGQGGSNTPAIDAGPRLDANGMSSPDMNCAAVNQGAAPLPPDI